jgi:uncharacterized protein YbjT (DUF2867 family)
MQFIAVEDIGQLTAKIFGEPARFRGHVLELAGDEVSSNELATLFSHAAGRPITYQRFQDSVLEANPFLTRLIRLMDEGPLAGQADFAALRQLHPGLLTVERWLSGPGKSAFKAALSHASPSTLPIDV